MNPPLLVAAVLVAASPAFAQAPPDTPPADAPTAAAEAGFDEAAYRMQYLRWDRRAEKPVYGRDERRLEREELYRLIGREDLLARHEQLRSRRLWTAIGAGASTVAGLTVAGVLLANRVDLNDPYCVANPTNYDECTDHYRQEGTWAMISAGVGVAGGVVLTTIAMMAHRAMNRPDQRTLIYEYNEGLKKKLSTPGTSLRLVPVVSPSSGGLMATLRF